MKLKLTLTPKAMMTGIIKFAVVTIGTVVFASSANADTINKYHYVADVIGSNDSDLYKAGRTGSGNLQSVVVASAGGTGTSINATLWDTPGSSFSSVVYRGESGPGTPGAATYFVGNASPNESDFNTYSSALSPYRVGIYSDSNPFSSPYNPYLRCRNFRVFYSGNVPLPAPVEVSYANIVDGGTYSTLPSVQDVQTNVTNVGFRGFATPSDTQYPGISKVYLSLQRLSDNLYWSGTQWSHLRVNLLANQRPVSSNYAGRVEWTKTGGLPTGANLPNGQYRLRTMAIEAPQFQTGAGTLNTITFTINGASNIPLQNLKSGLANLQAPVKNPPSTSPSGNSS